jgi:hypothetical protein
VIKASTAGLRASGERASGFLLSRANAANIDI